MLCCALLQELELRQREAALSLKIHKETQWYEQQRRKLRDKGSDDKHPQQLRRHRTNITKLRREQVGSTPTPTSGPLRVFLSNRVSAGVVRFTI